MQLACIQIQVLGKVNLSNSNITFSNITHTVG